VNGVIGDIVDSFERSPVRVTDADEPIFVVPFTSGRERLMADSEVLVVTGTSGQPGTLSSGSVVTGLAATGQYALLDATSDGSTVIVGGTTTGGPAVFLVERDIDAPVACAANPNSTGAVGDLRAEGSGYVAIDDLRLVASDLPQGQFTLLVTSQDLDFAPNPGGSEGNLCIGPDIGRFNDQILPVGAGGQVAFDVDLAMIPKPSSFVAGVPGETWHFQTWHRDLVGGAQTSNFTRAISVTLR